MEMLLTIFDEVQNSKRSFKSNVKKLIDLTSTAKAETVLLRGILDQTLLQQKSSSTIQRVLDFFSLFMTEIDENFLMRMIHHLEFRSHSSIKLVRQRVCFILAEYLRIMSENNAELSCVSLGCISKILLSRLVDKVSTVRAAAVNALQYLQDPENGDDEVSAQLILTMQSDSSPTIRCSIAKNLSLTETSKPEFVRRLRDVNKDVRLTVVLRLLKETDLRQFSKATRVLIIHTGLNDRDNSVCQATVSLLIRWLQLLNNDIIKFLTYFGPLENELLVYQIGTSVAERIYNESSLECADELRTTVPNWSADISSDHSSNQVAEFVWLYLRCQYIALFQSKFHLQSFVEEYLPSLAEYSSILTRYLQQLEKMHSRTTDSIDNEAMKVQTSVQYLFQLFPFFILKTDAVGSERLMSILRCYLSSPTAIHLADTIVKICFKLESIDNKSHFSNKNAIISTENVQTLLLNVVKQLRTQSTADSEYLELILIQSILQNVPPSLGLSADMISTFLTICLEGLQKQIAEIRSYAVNCLGLLCLLHPHPSDNSANSYYHQYIPMIKHIAINDFEDLKVKQQAQLALFDFCMVPHTSKTLLDNIQHKQDIDKFVAKTILKEDLNVLFSEQPLIVEGVMKLIFCGFSVDEAVVAKLLQTFFIYQNFRESNNHQSTKSKKKVKSSGEEVDLLQDMLTSDAQHLQQMLSVLLHSFLLSTVEMNRVDESHIKINCFEVVRQSMPLFIAEVTTAIRDELVAAATMTKAIQKLFGICQSSIKMASASVSKQEAANTQLAKLFGYLQETVFACVSCELLKLNYKESKIDKQIGKEYIRLLSSSFNFEMWLPFTQTNVVGMVLQTIKSNGYGDKLSMKWLDQLLNIVSSSLQESHEGVSSRTKFIDLAPGLCDIVRFSSDRLEDVSIILGRSVLLDKTSNSSIQNVLSDIEEEDDEENELDDNN